MWEQISRRISEACGAPFRFARQHAVGGGCINRSYRIEGADGRGWFVKTNEARLLPMFEAEADGLNELAQSHTVRVPEPLCWGEADGQAFLVLELLELGGRGGMERFGQELAAMHRSTRERFGWTRDNVIGATPQRNTELADWVSFWREHRLGFQLDLAARRGHGGALVRKGEHLMTELAAFFTDYRPRPSLLHGDLWSGNYAIDGAGEPVIFDPATYYGDREADIAMTELFGGFGQRFYDVYNEAWPLDPGYRVRKTLYNLYHIINHYNLFGGGYGGQAERMIDQLLAEVR